ncbi:putative MFS drug efflux transporter [Xylariaceae sp. FL0594]|nr:putative MFS drug efflux transporter [Xylariaceae sp. FL0594]
MAPQEHDSANKQESSSDEKQAAINHAPQPTELASRSLKPLSWFFVVFSLLAALFLFALDNTIVANVQENIIYSFGGIDRLPWISVAFALGAVATNLFWGQLFSHFDGKVLFIASIVIFEVGSVVCGAAPSLNALIGGRAICGIGGMGIYLGTLNMVSTLTTEQERPMYLGFVGLTWGIGTILGPIIGGAFADSNTTWRWSLDFVGAVLSAGAITTLVIVIAFGGTVYTWDSGRTIALFVTTGVLWIAFILQQRFSLFLIRSAQVVITVPIYFIPFYFQFAKAESALRSGVQLLPFFLPLVFAVMLNGSAMVSVGYYMIWYFVGSALSLAGSALLYTIRVNTSEARVYGFSVLTAFGIGLFSQAGFAVAQMRATPQLMSRPVAFMGIGQVGSITLALLISNSIFLNESINQISRILPGRAREEVQQAVSGFGGDFFDTLSQDQRQRVLDAIVASIDKTFILVITASALSLALSVFMKREKLVPG